MADAKQKISMRGTILKLCYQRHERQESRFNVRMLMLTLDDLGVRVYENLVTELVQDLGDRCYLEYQQSVNRKTGEVTIWQIQLTPKGRDLVEGLARDPAVDV